MKHFHRLRFIHFRERKEKVMPTRKWTAYKALERAVKNHEAGLNSQVIYRYSEHESIPIEAWEKALIQTAKLVERLGERYLPLFERVERELEKAKNKLHSLEKVRGIANGDFSQLKFPLRQQGYFIEP